MKKLNNTILILVFLLLFISCEKQVTEPKSNEIKGKIIDNANSNPVMNALIKTEPPSSSVFSDNNGNYMIQNILPGQYTVIVEKSGYYTFRTNVKVIEGKTTEANVLLYNILDNNKPPDSPIVKYPLDKGDINPIKLTISWICSDPDGDDLTYDIYLGKSSNALLSVVSNTVENEYIIENLDKNSTYYLKVIAKDIHGASTESELVKFTTFSNYSSNVPADSLIAYYSFNGNATDLGVHKLDGTVNNAVLTSDRKGNVNCAYYFNGNDSYIDIPHNDKFNFKGDYTFCLWLKPDNNQGNDFEGHIDVFSRCGTTIGGYYLGISKSLGLEYWISRISGGASGIFSPNTISSDKWYHIVIRFIKNLQNTSGKIEMILDGEIISSQLFYLPSELTNTNLKIGTRNNFNNYFTGKVDEVVIYNRALTDEEIKKLAEKL